MTIEKFLKKAKKLWFILLIFVILGAYLSYQTGSSISYNASLIVNIDLVNAGNNQNDKLNSVLYQNTSSFLSNIYSSKIIQAEILEKSGETADIIPNKNSFYSISPDQIGYITIENNFTDKDKAEKFLNSVKKVHNSTIVDLWNQQKPKELQTRPIPNFSSKIIEQKTSIAKTFLPLIIALFVAFLLILIIPGNKKTTEKTTEV